MITFWLLINDKCLPNSKFDVGYAGPEVSKNN